MPILSCRVLLLLAMVPVLVVAGRHIPAAPLTASSTPTPQVELTADLTAEEMGFGGVTWKRGRHYQDLSPPPPNRKILRGNVKALRKDDSIYGRRLLVGSAPPSCRGKCGPCVPCSPIHVSIGTPHGSVTQQEYYPEVWRCKCGNRFYMP